METGHSPCSAEDAIKSALDTLPAGLQDTTISIPHRGNLQLNLPATLKLHLSRGGQHTAEADTYDGTDQHQHHQQQLQQPSHQEVLQVWG